MYDTEALQNHHIPLKQEVAYLLKFLYINFLILTEYKEYFFYKKRNFQSNKTYYYQSYLEFIPFDIYIYKYIKKKIL